MERYVCIHSHFYQPPRENPWLEQIELQDSAYPYHDWNERITAECYAPNAVSRIIDQAGKIANIVNNYAKISFNFGPTILSWMEEREPDLYRRILEADRESREIFSGHGSAIAQAYNHVILPLANSRDKRTQVIWGARDFESRFGRTPEAMWLPETAVDLESLDLMANEGIRYAILEPHQAHRVRKKGSREWMDVTGGRIDPKLPYKLRLPSGRTIAVFFYDGPVSRAVAFEGLLNNGEVFANRILGAFTDSRSGRYQFVHIATDGESYGHHHAHGEMALSYALHHIESNGLARITNYGEFLEIHPPTHEVEIYENTSWSCVHGIERWKSNCGCNSGGRPGWNQEWRRPLREALDWLR
jgi:alpha-amylase/alpha-mannosidase (GH57 family)